MFERILALLQPKAESEAEAVALPDADVRHIIGALLVRAAKADKLYLFEEIEQIDEVLAYRYDLNPTQAAKLRMDCEVLDAAVPESEGLVKILRDSVSYDERVAITLSLWEVVFADGRKVETEEILLRQLEVLLGISFQKSRELHDLALAASE
jgi:uncharacterized tellurite resistance protein B-like protein